MIRPFFFAFFLLAALMFVGCGDDDGDATATPSAPATGSSASTRTAAASATGTGATPAATATAGGSSLPAFAPDSQVFKKDVPGSTQQAILFTVRAATNTGFDRIVFQFKERVPGYEVKYVDKVQTCAKGDTLALAGGKRVAVTFRPASAHSGDGPTVDTPNIESGLQYIREAKQSCDFEGVVGYGLGLLEARPFRVFELQDPPRIVIDFQQ